MINPAWSLLPEATIILEPGYNIALQHTNIAVRNVLPETPRCREAEVSAYVHHVK
jgi:hypothetical protein